MKTKSKSIQYLLLLVMITIWSFSFVFVDIATKDFIDPLPLAFYRFIVSSISFIVLDFYSLICSRNNVSSKKVESNETHSTLNKSDWFLLFISSFTGVSMFFYIQYTSIQLIGPSLPALLVCLLAPILITVFSLLFFNEKLTKLKIFGFTLASVGAFLLITGGDISNLLPSSPNFIGYILALTTPILWAVFSIASKQLTKKISYYTLLKIISYLGAIELLIFLIATFQIENFFLNLLNPIVLITALYLGLGCYVIGYYIWHKSQRELESSKAASFLYIEPFLTLLLSFIFQRNEIIVAMNIIGGIIVVLAVILINYE